MQKAIWGTGFYANVMFYVLKKEKVEIDFFIDSNLQKCGQKHLDKKIYCPDEILEWNELCIYIPYNFYNDIMLQLKKYGITQKHNFIKYYNNHQVSPDVLKYDFEQSINMLYNMSEQLKGAYLFWGRIWFQEEKGYKKFIQQLKEKDHAKMGMVSEAVWYTQSQAESFIKLPTVIAPGVFCEGIYAQNLKDIDNSLQYISSYPKAKLNINALMIRFSNLAVEDAKVMVDLMYQYVELALDILQPKKIICFARVEMEHQILEEVCVKKNIPLISTHQGILPGTLAFDIGGEMGKSLPALYPDKFLTLPVSEKDMTSAQCVWNYLFISKLNRKVQHKNSGVNYVMRNIQKGQPIIFYAGQNDLNSNMVPYSAETQKYHSPVFKSSIEAGIYIGELCKKNNWNFVYKPHPMATRYDKKELLPANTIYVEEGDINDLIDIADVVVTILSQTNYISLIRHKPVVMLGYNQIKGKGCTYEAFEKNKIEDTIKEALKKGFTKEQEAGFLRHIAQVLKYYLYDDGMEREIRFGREVPNSIEEFCELEKLLKEDAEIENVL